MSDQSKNYQHKPLASQITGNVSVGGQSNQPSSSSSGVGSQPTSSSVSSASANVGGPIGGGGGIPNIPQSGGIGGQGGGPSGSSGSSQPSGGSSPSSEYEQIIQQSKVAESQKNTDGSPKLLQGHTEVDLNQSWITRCENITHELRKAEKNYEEINEFIDEKGSFNKSQIKKHLEGLRNFKSFLPIACVTAFWLLLGIFGIALANTSSPTNNSLSSDNNISDKPKQIQSVSDAFKNTDSENTKPLEDTKKSSPGFEFLNSKQSQAVLILWLIMLVIGVGFCLYLLFLKNKALSFFKFSNIESGFFDCSEAIDQVQDIKSHWYSHFLFQKSIHPELPIKNLNFRGMLDNISSAKNIFLKRKIEYYNYTVQEEARRKREIEELTDKINRQLEPPPEYMVRKVEQSTRQHPYGEDVYKVRYGGMDFEICSKGVIFDYTEMSTIIGSDNPDVNKFRQKVKTENQNLFSQTCNPYLKNFEHLIDQLAKRDKELQANYKEIEENVPMLSPEKNGHQSAEKALEVITRLFANHTIIKNRKLNFVEGPETLPPPQFGGIPGGIPRSP